MAYYPIMLDIQGKNCLVVGGGRVAYRKTKALLECRAKVRVIAKRVCPEIQQLSRENCIRLVSRNYETGDIRGCALVIVATDSKNINKQVAEEAQRDNILVNVVDNKEQSSFLVPSVLRQGDLTLSIATNGKSPLLARKLREKLEGMIGGEYEELLQELYKARYKVKKQNLSMEEKLQVYEHIIDESGLI